MLTHPEEWNFDLASLHPGTCGGALADPAVFQCCAERFPLSGLVQVYALTEAAATFSRGMPPDPGLLTGSGTCLDGYEIRIANPANDTPLPAGRQRTPQGNDHPRQGRHLAGLHRTGVPGLRLAQNALYHL
jgi:acyl-CoA synthetase (AMP-forming)/AMP-acid ligase II